MCKLDNVDLGDVQLPVSFERRIDALLTRPEELNGVVLKLQLHSCTIRQVRVYFDLVLDVFTTVEVQLNQLVQIVHSPVFESAVLKIQDAREQFRTTFEKRSEQGLLLERSAAPEADPALDSIFKRAIKWLKASVTNRKSE